MRPHLWNAAILGLACSFAACLQPERAAVAGNEPVVREFFAAIDAGNLDRVQQLVTDDLTLHVLGVPETLAKEALLQAIKTFYAAFPDNTHVIEQTLEAGDRVAVILTQHATSKGPYEGASPTGQAVTIPAIHMMRLSNGRIQEWWALEDNLGLMQQLGMELKPKTAGPSN